jgi:hypothetical protein
MNRHVFFALCLIAASSATFTAAQESSTSALLACVDEADDTRRLQCFDRAVAGLRAGTAVGPKSAPAPASESTSARDRFGARGDLKQEQSPELKEITALVTAVRARPYGELVITLDNGQEWTQIAPDSRVKVKAGDTVKIEAGALDSFILIAANGRSAKVRRLR